MSKDTYRLSAHEIKKIHGGHFDVNSRGTSKKVRFKILPSSAVSPRKGAEAYGVGADGELEGRTHRTFLKVFLHRVPERNLRNRFLAQLRLDKRHWMFRGIPYGFISSRIVNGVEIHGNIAARICNAQGEIAPPISSLLDHGNWAYSRDQRARFAGQICCAVHALEVLELVHGDISLGNVLIGAIKDEGAVAVLVDFDGFFHPDLPLLPLRVGRHEIRRFGSPGFQSPLLLEEVARSPQTACVRSDRMALAALVVQLMVWEPKMATDLGRHHLLGDDNIKNRTLRGLPEELTNRWPHGFQLLEAALKATAYQDMPSPRSWLGAVGDFKPRLKVTYERSRPPFEREARLSKPSGTLEDVHRDLAGVRFSCRGEHVSLKLPWQAPIIVPLRVTPPAAGSRTVILQPGLTVSCNFWRFELLSGV